MTNYYFFRRGGAVQLRIESPEDLAAVVELDPKLWVALSMPVAGQTFDARTLALLDSDGDGRIRVQEILSAVKFVRENFSNFEAFFAGKDSFLLSALTPTSTVAGTAKTVLSRLGKPEADCLSLADVEAAEKAFDAQVFNGDGVLVPACAGEDAATEKFLSDAVSATGGSPDASGKPGVTASQITDFLKNVEKVLAWRNEAEQNAEKIFPLGDKTEEAYSAFERIRTKVEDFFARTRLVSFDPSAEAKLNPSDSDFAALASEKEISLSASECFPLARIVATEGEPAFPLASGVNPAWVSALSDFAEKTLRPVLGKFGGTNSDDVPGIVSASLWEKISSVFEPYAAWLSAKPSGGADAFPSDRLREILSGSFDEKASLLFAKDAEEKPLRIALSDTEKLCRYTRDLAVILRNFVSFAEFYKRDADKTAFLAGKLYMDRRTCSMCVQVDNAASHSALAAKSNCCLAYCDCTRKNGSEKMSVVAMFGDGDALSLYVGRNGVFYDKQGNDWDAKIVKIIENPISIRQAFWSPYRKVAKFVETQIENFAAAREKKVDGDLSASAGTALSKAETGAGTADTLSTKPAFDVAKFAGIFAAIGLAIGAVGAALSVALSGFLSLAPWQMILVILAIILMVSAPSMLSAAMKLRRRSLGPILEANGWAINGNVKINIPLGKAFTEMPKKPKGSRIFGTDPFARKAFPRKTLFAVLALAALAVVGGIHYFCSEGNEGCEPDGPGTGASVPAEASASCSVSEN